MNNLFGLIKFHGWNGIKAFIKLKLYKLNYIVLKGDKEIHVFIKKFRDIVHLRKNTSDYSTFKQIFKDEDYNIDFDFTPKFIVDAGANIGLASIYFSNRFRQAQIVAIEPEQSNLSMMKTNLKAYDKVSVISCALHHTANETLNIVDPGIGKWGFITESTSQDSKDKHIVSKVKTTSIDSILSSSNFDIIDILKIDIEGAEKSLFEKKYENWLPKIRCIIIELHDRYYPDCTEVVLKAMNQFDFWYFEKGENLIFMNNKL